MPSASWGSREGGRYRARPAAGAATIAQRPARRPEGAAGREHRRCLGRNTDVDMSMRIISTFSYKYMCKLFSGFLMSSHRQVWQGLEPGFPPIWTAATGGRCNCVHLASRIHHNILYTTLLHCLRRDYQTTNNDSGREKVLSIHPPSACQAARSNVLSMRLGAKDDLVRNPSSATRLQCDVRQIA